MKNSEFIRRRGLIAFFAVLAAFLLTVCAFVGVFWWNGRDRAYLTLSQKYYFLVRPCEASTAAAVAGQVYVSGGSGFYIEAGRESAVVVACYFREETALSVRDGMAAKGVETQVLALKPAELRLNGRAAALCEQIAGNVETVDSCARLLYDTANGLERTELTQDAARAALCGVRDTLKGLQAANADGTFARWNTVLKEAERKSRECADGILFAKDVRYIQAMLCYAVVSVGNYFA